MSKVNNALVKQAKVLTFKKSWVTFAFGHLYILITMFLQS
jgi:hypothetical protein